MRTETKSQKLVFEGAGWSGAEHNGVGNCRIRGVFTTSSGRHIYLEMGGIKTGSNSIKSIQHLDFAGRVDHCFYLDSLDRKSSDISKYEKNWWREYTKKNIVELLNSLGVEGDDFEVDNDNPYSVFEDERYKAFEAIKGA